MSVQDLPIETYSFNEKLLLMERLWAELARKPQDLAAPSWHKKVLEDRLKAVKDGTESFVDWDDAKKRLRERLP